MKKSNRKMQIIVIAAIVLIVGISITGATLAFFRAEDEVKNTFTFGNISIRQIEQEIDENGDLIDYDHDKTKVFLPIVDVDHPQEDKHYYDKIVTVQNNGSSDAYVRTFIAVPREMKDLLILDYEENTKWIAENAQMQIINGIMYDVYPFTYRDALVSEEYSDVLLKGVYMRWEVDHKIDPSDQTKKLCLPDPQNEGEYVFYNYDPSDPNSKVNIIVATQGVQTIGFSADPALGLTASQVAVNTGFASNPWG